MPLDMELKIFELANAIYDFNDSEDDTDSILVTIIINELIYINSFHDLIGFNQISLTVY